MNKWDDIYPDILKTINISNKNKILKTVFYYKLLNPIIDFVNNLKLNVDKYTQGLTFINKPFFLFI